MILKGKVTIPFTKYKVSKKILLVIAVGIIGYIYYRKKQNDAIDAATQGLNVGPEPFAPLQPGELRTDTGRFIEPKRFTVCHCPKGYRQRGTSLQNAVCASIAPPGLILPCNKPPPPEPGRLTTPPGINIPTDIGRGKYQGPRGRTTIVQTSSLKQLKI